MQAVAVIKECHQQRGREGAITLTSHGCMVNYRLHRVVFPTPLQDAIAMQKTWSALLTT